MQYEVTIVKVDDADAIVINYHDGVQWWTTLVDAGNVGDGAKIKPYIKHKIGLKLIVDYAFCTHPDRDHKGGFFDLFSDPRVVINALFIRRPDIALSNDPRKGYYAPGRLEAFAKAVYNHPADNSMNLIDIAIKNNCLQEPILGLDLNHIPIKLIGPRPAFFTDACYEMALDFAELEDEADYESYAEDELPTEEEAKSIMDEVKEDSATNKSSMILLFHPFDKSFLLTGDACSASIHDAIDDFPNEIPGSVLKVPHHGSKHNLTTEVIDLLRPGSAVISCKGTKKHPNRAIVHFLSKHCNVYATSKSGTLIYTSEPVNNPALALRYKQ